MESCKQIELFQGHANAANQRNHLSSKKPKHLKGKDSKDKGGGKGLLLHYLQPAVTTQQQPPSASPLASLASPSREQSTLPHAGKGKGKGKGGKGKGN